MRYLLNPYSWSLADPNSLPYLFLQHMYIVAVAMAISIVIALPIGLLVAKVRRLYAPVVAVAATLYSLPSLAFVAVMVTITGLSLGTVLIPLIVYN